MVAPAPWCPPGEPVAQLRDRDVLVLHGDRDRVTDPAESAAYVVRARAAGARAGMLLVANGDHAMLRNSTLWHRTASAVVAHLLAPETAPGGPFVRGPRRGPSRRCFARHGAPPATRRPDRCGSPAVRLVESLIVR
ncbi:hypothetical protein [Streptomyces sp. NPDC054808]